MSITAFEQRKMMIRVLMEKHLVIVIVDRTAIMHVAQRTLAEYFIKSLFPICGLNSCSLFLLFTLSVKRLGHVRIKVT